MQCYMVSATGDVCEDQWKHRSFVIEEIVVEPGLRR